MKIKITEKKESLETIILGINQDPYRVNFHGYLKSLDIVIEKEVLNDQSEYAVIVEIDGVESKFKAYPNAQETADLFGVDSSVFKEVKEGSGLLQAANTTRIGNCCGVGEDIYCDPNEEN